MSEIANTNKITNPSENVNPNESIKNNSEILFIYDAKMCNPNGDPDDENKPRMDYERGLNLVSDLRLKRYIRDYLADFKKHIIFVSKVEGEIVDATNRLRKLIEESKEEIYKDENLKRDLFKVQKSVKGKKSTSDSNEPLEVPEEKNLSKHLDWLLSKLIDVRFFGATMTLKNEDGKGDSITLTGPIQFNWGYSLNKVIGPMETNGITSTFAGAKEDYGTMGKDYRVNYSLIAFHGIISAKRAESTKLTNSDICVFDDAILKSIPLEATTRSKIGQKPLMYIRVEYDNSEYFLGDLRKHLKIVDEQNNELSFDDTAKLRSTKDYKLDVGELCEKLKSCDSKIQNIHFWKDSDFNMVGWKPTDTQKIIKL